MNRCTACENSFTPGDECTKNVGKKCTSRSTSRQCGCSFCLTIVLAVVIITCLCLFPMILSNEGFKWLMRTIGPLLPSLVPSRNPAASAVSGSDDNRPSPPPGPPPGPDNKADISDAGLGSGSDSGSGSGSGHGSGSGSGKIKSFFQPENKDDTIRDQAALIEDQKATIKAQEAQAAEDAKKIKEAEEVQEKAIKNLKPTFDNLLHAFKFLDILYGQQCGELTVNFVTYQNIATHNHYLLGTKYTPWKFHNALMIAEEANNASLSHCSVWLQNFSTRHQEFTTLTSNSKTLIEIALHSIEFKTVYNTVQKYQGNLSDMESHSTEVSKQINNFSKSDEAVWTRMRARESEKEILRNVAVSVITTVLVHYGPMFAEQVTSFAAYVVANLPVCDIYSQNPDMHSAYGCDSLRGPSAAIVVEEVPSGPE